MVCRAAAALGGRLPPTFNGADAAAPYPAGPRCAAALVEARVPPLPGYPPGGTASPPAGGTPTAVFAAGDGCLPIRPASAGSPSRAPAFEVRQLAGAFPRAERARYGNRPRPRAALRQDVAGWKPALRLSEGGAGSQRSRPAGQPPPPWRPSRAAGSRHLRPPAASRRYGRLPVCATPLSAGRDARLYGRRDAYRYGSGNHPGQGAPSGPRERTPTARPGALADKECPALGNSGGDGPGVRLSLTLPAGAGQF